MRKLTITLGAVMLSLVQGACADRQTPTSPIASGASASRSAAVDNDRAISALDACDGPSFTAAQIDCSRQAGVKLDQFIAELTARGSVGAWHFAASNINAFAGQTLDVTNRGGETHTFTEVAHFGGGIVPLLNQLSGNLTPAPECLDLAGNDFIPSGATHHATIDGEGTELYQCCIHPWMRVVVNAKSHG
jgi:plastocyanin